MHFTFLQSGGFFVLWNRALPDCYKLLFYVRLLKICDNILSLLLCYTVCVVVEPHKYPEVANSFVDIYNYR